MTTSHIELDGLSLTELIGRLRDVHTTRTPLGWPTEHAVTKSAIERRIVDLVLRRETQPVDDPNQRITCDLDIKVRTADRPSVKADRVVVQVGGLFVETDAAIELGESVEVEVTTEHSFRMRVRGTVGFQAHRRDGQAPGIGIGFGTVVGDSAERRLERMVLELIRNRLL